MIGLRIAINLNKMLGFYKLYLIYNVLLYIFTHVSYRWVKVNFFHTYMYFQSYYFLILSLKSGVFLCVAMLPFLNKQIFYQSMVVSLASAMHYGSYHSFGHGSCHWSFSGLLSLKHRETLNYFIEGFILTMILQELEFLRYVK